MKFPMKVIGHKRTPTKKEKPMTRESVERAGEFTTAPLAAADVIGKDAAPAAVADDFAGLVPGRIVYYTPTEAESRTYHKSDGPWPAQVLKVGENGVVTLLITLPEVGYSNQTHEHRKNVAFNAEGMRGTWRWMLP